VLGFGQLLEREDLDDRQRESVGYILKAGNHLLTLIDEVLDLSRIETRTMALSPEPVEAREIIVEALDLIGPIARSREVTVQFAEQHGPIPYVLADHQRLKQILLNLLSNAVKYNSRGGSVVVSVALPSAAMVRINVTDTGPGIDTEHRSRLFTPFERLGAEGGPEEGTGIGLALSRHLAWVMGGELDVESEPGRGSTFWLQLPVAEEQVRKFERLNTRTRLERADPMSTQRRDCILQIEDNASNSRLMERVLESRPEFELIVAGLGRLGEEFARQHQPKMILLDLHLPDISGEEVLHHLREDPATAHIPVVIVSADGTHGQERRLLNAGAVAYVTKPFDVNELLSVIDNAVSTPTAASTQA
jgi:CheY-like chemotaxis protein/anti-sigma regulatory factor (Ser/Thr protein kinase)